MRAAVATAQLADAVGPVDGVEVVVWNGDGPPPEGDVDFWVPHYATRADVIDRGPARGAPGGAAPERGVRRVPRRLPAGITLCNATGVHDASTAEHAVGLILACLREIPAFVRSQATGPPTGCCARSPTAGAHPGLRLHRPRAGESPAPIKVSITAVATRERDDDLVGRVRAIDDLPELLPDQDVVVALVPLSDAHPRHPRRRALR